MKRIVKLIAIDARYKDSTPYPYRCVFNESIGTYLTGQHVEPSNPETADNLTLEEMTGKKVLTPEKAARFPFVINPLNRINFKQNDLFDISQNAKGEFINKRDYALWNLLKNYGWFVAQSKGSVIPRKHFFYLHDEIFEAETRLKSSDDAYAAEKYVREELSENGMRDLALVLSYKIATFSYDRNTTTDTVLKDRILDVCRKTPEKILEAKESAFKDEVFVLKLSMYDILRQKGTDFYSGNEFIGANLEQVKKYMKTESNTPAVSRWSRMLADKEGTAPKFPDADNKEKVNERFEEIKLMNVEELQKYAGSKRYPRAEWGEITTQEELQKYLISKVKI